MAASVYATPPPDFSGEEAAMSDTSNSSQTNSSINSAMKASKRSLSSAFLHSPQALNTATQLSSDSLPDLSKKRRKQSMPSRISGNGTEEGGDGAPAETSAEDQAPEETDEPIADDIASIAEALAEQQNNFQKIFLSNLSQLQKQHLLQHRVDQPMEENSVEELNQSEAQPTISLKSQESLLSLPLTLKDSNGEKPESADQNGESEDNLHKSNGNQPSFDRNENEVKSDDNTNRLESKESDGNPEKLDENDINGEQRRIFPGLTLKKELMQDPEWDGEIRSSSIPNITKPDDWLSIPGLPFPFPPEAAAALSASGYLPQLPLLGLPSASSFNSGDNGNRPNLPPLKIFNPEAYCELCNKEFCNKYFLKTHKANKHGIYEPQSGGNDSLPNLGSFNPLHQLSQVFQMQQQQAALQEQQDRSNLNNHNQIQNNDPMGQPQQPLARPTTSPKLPMNPIQPTVFCDICCKKFSSLSAMRKHRSKAHEVSNNQQQHQQQQPQQQFQLQQHLQAASQPTDQRPENLSPSDAERTTPAAPQFRIPEGFREDYSIEQEDASFTPQPRKLSPASIQAAREANFSADKLKRLGVINPEAFCEICCKEYCNKYFLRTHKLKRHGIFLPPDEIKEERNPWSFVQTSPLNLIVGGTDPPGFPPPLKKLSDASNQELSRATALKEELLKSVNTNGDSERHEEENDDKQGMSSAEQEAEAISVDLQKLQSMIMQLNDLNNQRKMTCGICGKEMENQYLLHAHMIQEHNNMNENNNGMKSPLGSAPMPTSPSEYEVCKQCDKEFSNAFVLKQHLIEVHGAQNVSPKREGFITPERPTTAPNMNMPTGPVYGDRKPTFSMTPTSSYCEICNKELCNKYFMKTHMQRMHGIEIENGAQIGGVVCNICNKELCSKYFLRVHKHNTHGIVEEGAPLPQPRNSGDHVGDNSEMAFSAEGLLKPGEISDLSNRYYSHFTEVCPLCSRRFRSAKWLRAHLLSDHGKMGVDKLRELELKLGSGSKSNSPSLKIPNGFSTPEQKFNTKAPFGFNTPDGKMFMKNPFSGLFGVDPTNSNVGPNGYQCSYCPFATPLLPLLFIHERTHTNLNIMQQQLLQEEEQKQQAQLSPIQLPIIKSESAAAPAKDSNRFPMPTSVPSSETPSLTPASTPVPAVTQEATTQQASPQPQNAPAQPTFERESPNQPEVPKSPALKSEHNALLSEMANLTQRPAVYALPQQSGPLLMQSFLLEESAGRASPKNGEDHPLANRFVPAVVFLPVKERILSPMTISFTLSPA